MDLLASTDLTGVIRSLKKEEGAVATGDMSKDKIDGESRNNSWMRDLTDLQKQLVELTSEKKNRSCLLMFTKNLLVYVNIYPSKHRMFTR